MDPDRRCANCGQVIPWGQVKCPLCAEHGGYLWTLRRDTFLLLTVLILIVLFVLTGFAARSYHARQRVLGGDWFARGDKDLGAGRAKAAVEDFRTALVYARQNTLYELKLAQALAAAGRLDEARAYLVTLWEREPGSGTVNLELAHLAVRTQSLPDALRYFHGAIYGEWADDPARRRQAARLELAEFLHQIGERSRAQSELIALAADLPDDPQVVTQVGTLLLQNGEHDQALKLFRRALNQNSRLDAALAGAGEVYFEQNNFTEAQRYLSQAVAENPHLSRAADLLEATRLVLSVDPFERHLGDTERAQRTIDAFNQAMSRLEHCAAQRRLDLKAEGSDELQKLYTQAVKLQPRLRKSSLDAHSALLFSVMDLVFEIEKVAQRECGEPQPLDKALLLVARAQGGARP